MKIGIGIVLAIFVALNAGAQDDEIKLSLDKLFSLKVTSVSGTAMDMKKSPAAIYVITSEDFKKQGHRTLPDALRAVPGFHVRRLNSNKWSISARGNNGRFANKLLVLIDGRSVYTPLFSGVYWEIQDLPLEDIDRIEVIRGPGATLWGANAVNGVINIVTKKVRDTEGGYLKLGTGSHSDYETEYRYGWQVTDNVFMKVWGKNFARGESEYSSGLDANDSWDGGHWGAKLDWYTTATDTHSFQANFSKLNIGNEAEYLTSLGRMPDEAALTSPPYPAGLAGFDINSVIPVGVQLFDKNRRSTDFTWTTANVLWSWNKALNATSGWTLQTYYDYTNSEDELFSERRDTFDIDFRHWFNINSSNSFIWGLNWRTTEDFVKGSDTVFLSPEKRRIDTYSGFLQNTTEITDHLSLMYGSKIEWNDQTGLEIQPSVRLTYEYSEDTVFWASWARAVRRPSRAEDDVRLFQADNFTGDLGPVGGIFPQYANIYVGGNLQGNRDQDSEELLAYEMGVRTDFFDKKVTIDLTGFYFDYNGLTSLHSTTDPTVQTVGNKENAHTYGVETSVKYRPTNKLDFMFNYTWFRSNDDSTTVSDAEHVFFTAMNYRILKNLSWHTTAYYSGNIPSVNIEPYINVDMGLIWEFNKNWSFSVWGKNLLDPQHSEGNTEYFDSETYQIPRSVFFEATYKF